MNKNIIVLLILAISFSSSGELYKVFVDKEFGFFAVRSNESYNISYDNRTLYINKGDIVEWENSVFTDERLWIISDNRLWNRSDGLISSNFKVFRYTFDKVGTYKVHIDGSTVYNFPNNSIIQDKNISKATKIPRGTRYQSTYQTIMVGSRDGNIIVDIVSKVKDITGISNLTKTKDATKTKDTTKTNTKSIISDDKRLEDEDEYYEPSPDFTKVAPKEPLFSSAYQKLTFFEVLKKLLNK